MDESFVPRPVILVGSGSERARNHLKFDFLPAVTNLLATEGSRRDRAPYQHLACAAKPFELVKDV